MASRQAARGPESHFLNSFFSRASTWTVTLSFPPLRAEIGTLETKIWIGKVKSYTCEEGSGSDRHVRL